MVNTVHFEAPTSKMGKRWGLIPSPLFLFQQVIDAVKVLWKLTTSCSSGRRGANSYMQPWGSMQKGRTTLRKDFGTAFFSVLWSTGYSHKLARMILEIQHNAFVACREQMQWIRASGLKQKPCVDTPSVSWCDWPCSSRFLTFNKLHINCSQESGDGQEWSHCPHT